MDSESRSFSHDYLGDPASESVREANHLMEVTALLYYLSGLLHNRTVLERPLGSLLDRAPLMAAVLRRAGRVTCHIDSGEFNFFDREEDDLRIQQ